MSHAAVAVLTVQRWGNSLAVRIPAAIARRAHFLSGTSVEIQLEKNGISVRSLDETHVLTLDERLARFDPQVHGGEIMPSGRVGVEHFE